MQKKRKVELPIPRAHSITPKPLTYRYLSHPSQRSQVGRSAIHPASHSPIYSWAILHPRVLPRENLPHPPRNLRFPSLKEDADRRIIRKPAPGSCRGNSGSSNSNSSGPRQQRVTRSLSRTQEEHPSRRKGHHMINRSPFKFHMLNPIILIRMNEVFTIHQDRL